MPCWPTFRAGPVDDKARRGGTIPGSNKGLRRYLWARVARKTHVR